MKKKPTFVRINVLVEKESKKYIESLSKRQGISQAEVLRDIIRYYADATQK